MLKRFYLLIFIVAVIAWSRYVATPEAAPPAAPRAEAAADAPERDPSSEPPRAVAPRPVVDSPARARPSRADVAPMDLLERKPGRARRPRGTDDPTAPPMARYRGLSTSAEIKVGRRGYRVLGARAIRSERYQTSDGAVLFDESGYRVVAYGGEGWDQVRTFAEGQPVLVNPSNGRLGLVTGTIEVSTGTVEVAEAIATAENLTLVNYDRAIGLAFLRAPADYALLPGLTRIVAHPGVTGAELEIVENRKVAQ